MALEQLKNPLKEYVGDPDDYRCKSNMIKPISRKVCRNNCKHFKIVGLNSTGTKYKRKCEIGY